MKKIKVAMGFFCFLLCFCGGNKENSQSNSITEEESKTKQENAKSSFRIAVFADTHLIDDQYECCEGNELDTETIYKTEEHFLSARDELNKVTKDLGVEFGFIIGDVFHDYPYTDLEKYKTVANKSNQIKYAAEILKSFEIPIHIAWGNHDYDINKISREDSHKIFKELFNEAPYKAFDFGGWKFILVNTQLGDTWNKKSPLYNTELASLGKEQLSWVKKQLEEGKPTIIFSHYMLIIYEKNEYPDGEIQGFPELLKEFDNVKLVLSGHTHRWINLSTMNAFEHYVIGAIRYDPHNYWILELEKDTDVFKILDFKKSKWSNTGAEKFDYTDYANYTSPFYQIQ